MKADMFINREEELSYLNTVWNSNQAELIIVWGRRRIGKTRLLMEFSKNKRSLYLYVYHASSSSILNFFTKEIMRQLNVKFPTGYAFPDWNAFFEYLVQLAEEEKLLVIIDEFQRLADVSPEAIELLQYWWDKKLKRTKIKLVLVGSSIGMIEKVALSGSGPLYGRKTGLLSVKSMGFFDFIRAFNHLDTIKLIELYAIFGGTPHYFMMIDPNKSVEDNIIEKIASPYAPLRDEPEQLLRTELRSLAIYMDILEKMARGYSISVGDIASSLNKSRSEIYPYLIRLEKMDIISREYRPTDKVMEYRRARFKITDNYIRFWFNFIYPNYSEIERGNVEAVLGSYKREKNRYISHVYEEIVNEYLLRFSGRTFKDALNRVIRLPKIHKTGRWWWKDTEIDICAVAENTIILGEVKWREQSITEREINELLTRKTRIFLQRTGVEKMIEYLIATKRMPKGNVIDLIKHFRIILILPSTLITQNNQ
mgnify:CR=1 FL=1